MAPSDLSPVAAFWRNPRFRVCMVVCDTRRGTREGQESEKVLAFYPSGSSASQGLRTAIVGLGQAFCSFSSSFAQPSSSPVAKFVEADKNRWAMMELHGPRDEDRGLLLMMVVNKAWAGPGASNEAMKHSLTLLQSQAELLHGPLYDLIDQDPSANLFKRHVQPLVEELSRRIQLTHTKDIPLLPSLSNPLAIHSGLPLLHTSQRALVAAQCLANGLMTISNSSERIVSGSLICWKGRVQPIWCGGALTTRDCETLSRFTAHALIHKQRPMVSAAVEVASSAAAAFPSMMMLGGASSQAIEVGGSYTLLDPQCWTRRSPASEAPSSGPMLPSSSSSAGYPLASHSLHLTQRSGTTRSKAGSTQMDGQASFFLIPKNMALDQQGGTVPTVGEVSVLSPATVWVAGLQRFCRLLPYHHGSLIVLVLLNDQEGPLTREAADSITEVLAIHSPPLSALLDDEFVDKNLWHVPGYRYYNNDRGMVKATPGSKVKTLSSNTLTQAAATIDRMQSASELKILMATRGHAEGSTWVVSRKEGDQRAITTMEKVPEGGLPAAVSHAQKVLL